SSPCKPGFLQMTSEVTRMVANFRTIRKLRSQTAETYCPCERAPDPVPPLGFQWDNDTAAARLQSRAILRWHEHADAAHPVWLLRAPRERPRSGWAAQCEYEFSPSDGDCHAPLPCEVRKRNDTMSRACSLAVQGGQDAGCFDLSLRLQLHYSRRQLLANAAIA